MSEEEVNLVPLTLDADGKPLPEPLPIPEEPLEEPKLVYTEEDTDQHAVPTPQYPIPNIGKQRQQAYQRKQKAITIAQHNFVHYTDQYNKHPSPVNERLYQYCRYIFKATLSVDMNALPLWCAHPWTPSIREDGSVNVTTHDGRKLKPMLPPKPKR